MSKTEVSDKQKKVFDDTIYMIDDHMFESQSVLSHIVRNQKGAFTDTKVLHEILDNYPTDKMIKIVINTCGGELAACGKILKKLLKHPAGYTVYIRNECFSAGSIIALGAKEIVMNDDSYLGKIDPQHGETQLIVFKDIPEKYIDSHNIHKIIEAQYVLNYLDKLLALIFDNKVVEQKEQKELVDQHMVYSKLPHETTFDKNECLNILKLKVREPTDSEKIYFDNKIKVKNYKKI